MGHITSKSYRDLQQRLDKHAQGAPESDALFKILELLFSEKEAQLVSKLPIKFFTAEKAAKRWKIPLEETKKILNTLADKGLLLDVMHNKKRQYILPPTMPGFFEFSLMRMDGKFNNKLLSEMYYQYINNEEDFVNKALLQYPGIDRTFVHEDTVKSEILDYEKASHVIKTASCIVVGQCYCRHKMEHVGKACDMPQDVCLSFNNAAKSLAKHGIAKEISKEEAMKILDRCRNLGLVQIGDNVKNHVNWICNCCGCCCEAILAFKKLGYRGKMHSNFYPKVNHSTCIQCKACINKCPLDAIKLVNGKIKIDMEKCIGCGVCGRFCKPKSIEMKRRKKQLYVPVNSFERIVLNAIEQNKLQNYIFDNYELWSNEMLRHFLKILLYITPLKLVLAQKQLKSRFIENMIKAKKSFSK